MEYIRAWAEVDTSRLINNVRAIKSVIPAKSSLMAVVKADAYGHGAHVLPRILLENGADSLGVAICEEGVALRESGITAPILVMGYTPRPLLETAIDNNLISTVFSAESCAALSKICAKQNKKAEVHIKIDTGMSRLGIPLDCETSDTVCGILRDPAFNVTGICTHFAASDDFMCEQYDRFMHFLGLLASRGVPVDQLVSHAGASGMLASGRDMYLDMVRIGIMLYGLSPIRPGLDIKPVMRLMSRVSMVKIVPPGTGISYNRLFTTSRESKIATISIGYADGYSRALTNKGIVSIRGRKAPIVGAVCMDQCMADVTDLPFDIPPGEPVVMFDDADAVASQIGTIGYEVVCAVSKRVPRIYA